MAVFEIIKGSGSTTGYDTIEGNGTAVAQETTINFIGTGVTVTDDSLNSRTNVTITGGTYNQTIEGQGTAVAQEPILNFASAGFTVVDDSGNTRTNVSLTTNLVDISALTPTLNTIIYGNGTDFTNAALTQQQTVYVALNGSDTTGNGSINFPYRTLFKANTTITDAANLKKYVVAFLGGRFDEANNIVLLPYVAYVGLGSSMSYLTSPNNEISPDSSYNNANGRTSLCNIYVGGSTGVNWDLSSLGTTGSCVLDLQNVEMNGGLTYIGRDNGADFLQTEDAYWLGDTQLSNCQVSIYGGFSGGTFTYDTASTTGHDIGNIFGFQFNGNASFATTSGVTMNLTIQQSPVSTNTLSITGATTTISIDNDSLPTLMSNYTVSGGASVTFLTSDYGITSTYTPVNYTPTSSTVDGNFEGLDNALASLNPFQFVVITGDTTMAVNTGYIVNAVSTVTLTLPATFVAGAEIRVVGYAGGFIVAQQAGQSIAWGNTSTTLGVTGSLTSSLDTDCLDIVAVAANSTFVVADASGEITVT